MPDSPDSRFGYHGTDRENVDSILENGFWPSTRELNWLGDGCYFYEDLTYTKHWCSEVYPPLANRGLAFFQCSLVYGDVLEMTLEACALIKEWKEAIESRSDVMSLLKGKGLDTMTDAMVVNNYCRFLQKEFGRVVDTLRLGSVKTINSRQPWEGARFKVGLQLNASQVCIRPHAAAKNISEVTLLSD